MLRLGLISILALVLALGVSPVQATGGALCLANPMYGPPGTAFTITCTGFTPDKIVNAYVTEPDGRAVGAGQISGFVSNLNGGSILTDHGGNATFTWQSAGGGAAGFANQLGTWIWVVHELGQAGAVANEGQVTVKLTSVAAPQSGALLSVSPNAGTTFNFAGTGFDPFEMVNVWVTLPANCSGRANVEAASAVEPLIQGVYDGFFGPNTVKADADGNVAFSLVFTPLACRGQYQVTAHAMASARGGITSFEVIGGSIRPSALLVATPSSVSAVAPFLTLSGSGYAPGSDVYCWTTRPDGRVFGVGGAHVDGNGNFNVGIHASALDSFSPFASEEPGIWYATCSGPTGSPTAVTSFMVTSLIADP